MKDKPQNQSKSHHTCGIFVNASYINHSCYSNARRSFIGDMQIVRATRNIPADSEIFFWYAKPEAHHTYEKMQEKLKTWAFQCTCAICQQDQKTKKSILGRRLTLLKDLEIVFGCQYGADLAKAKRLLDVIEKTYPAPATDVPRLAISEAYLLLATMQNAKKQYEEVIESAWKVLISLGFQVKKQDPLSLKSPFEIEQWGLMEGCVMYAWQFLRKAYAQVAPDLCKTAEKYAKISYKICIGEDETFNEKWDSLAQQITLEGKK